MKQLVRQFFFTGYLQNNGRLAMIGIAGFVAQELVDGQTIIGESSLSN